MRCPQDTLFGRNHDRYQTRHDVTEIDIKVLWKDNAHAKIEAFHTQREDDDHGSLHSLHSLHSLSCSGIVDCHAREIAGQLGDDNDRHSLYTMIDSYNHEFEYKTVLV